MKKGCFYWLFIGFWLEPMIWMFKIVFALIGGFLSALFSGLSGSTGDNKEYEIFQGNNCDEEYHIGQDEIEEIKYELKDEIKDELYNDLYDEIYEKVINDIENEKN